MLVCGRLRKCKPFLSLLLLRSVCSSGAPRHRSGSPSAAIVPLERRASLPAGPQGLPARSAAAVTRKGRNGVEEPRSGLTAAGDRARERRFRAQRGPSVTSEPIHSCVGRSHFLQMVRCMRSGAVVCPASLIAARHTPRACMEIRGSSPRSSVCARRHVSISLVFPTPSH